MQSLRFSQEKLAGYTLIEILVSTTILLLIVGGGMAAYRNFATKQTIVNATRNFAVDLRTVQKKARSGEKPADCGTQTLDGWEVVKNSGDDFYITRAICGGAPIVSSEQLEELESGARFVDSSFAIQFTVITGFTNTQTTITLQSGDLRSEVRINQAGGIEEYFID